MTTYQQHLKKNVQSCSKVFDSIDRAKNILAQLEQMTVETSQGNYPDMVAIVEKTHALRHNLDLILVGLIEARIVEDDQSCSRSD